MEPALKLRRIADIRQQLPYLSHTALASVFTIAQEQELPRCSRHDVRKARDAVVKVDTPYGSLLKTKSLAGVHGGEINIDIIDPFAYMWAAASRDRFADILERAITKSPSHADQPWTLLLYADEVTPGNVKKSDNKKRVHGLYWILKELGPDAMSKEDMWATIAVLRSTTIAKIDGGMSAVMAMMLKSFFSDTEHHMGHGGCSLQLHGRSVRIWARFGGFIADEAALHSIWLCKGASGTKLCVLCMNVVSKHWTGIPGLAVDSFLKPFNHITKCRSCELHTKATIQHIVNTLAADRPVLTPDEFKAKERAFGFNHNAKSILLDPALRNIIDPTTQTLFDWPHSILQGAFPVQLALLETRLAGRRITFYEFLDEYLQGWCLPKKMSGTSWRSVFNAKRREPMVKNKEFKASMSETLSLHPIIGHWLRTVVMPQGHFVAECQAYFAISTFIDTLHAAGRGKVRAAEVKWAAEAFLDTHAIAYGVGDMIPKFHHSLHWPDIVDRVKTLPTTLPLERKHKTIKMFAEATDNTSRTWDTSILLECTFKGFGVLANAQHLRISPGLLDSPNTVPVQALAYLRDHVGDHDYTYAVHARYSSEGTSSAGDVVAYKNDGGWLPGAIHFFVAASGRASALVRVLEHKSHELTYSIWQEKYACIIVALEDIITSLTFRKDVDIYTVLHPWSLQRE